MSSDINRTHPSRRAFGAFLGVIPFLGSGAAIAQSGIGTGDVPPNPKRIVVLDAGLAGYALALEAPVVAADVRFPDGRINRRTRFPPLWTKQAVAAKVQPLPAASDGVDLGAVRAAAPDLILAGGRNAGGVQSRGAIAELSKIAPTLVMPATLPDWRSELAYIAKALGRSERVAGLEAAYDSRAGEVAGKITRPEGEIELLQANPAGIHEDPFAIAAGSGLGRALAALGFKVADAATKVAGATPDADGRVVVPIAEVLDVFSAPNLIIVSNGPVSMGQLCCDPGYRQLDAVINYRRWELDESAVRPDYLSALRLLDMIESNFPKKA